jgi:hypothetical protein
MGNVNHAQSSPRPAFAGHSRLLATAGSFARRGFLQAIASTLAGTGIQFAFLSSAARGAEGEPDRDANERYEPYGVVDHPNWLHFYKDDKEVETALRLMQEAGIQWLRFGANWQDIEPRRGENSERQLRRIDLVVDLARKLGIRPYLVVVGTARWASAQPEHKEFWSFASKDLDDWSRYVEMLVQRYRGRVSHWEIWNEIDLGHFWKSGFPRFVDTLRAAHRIIKAADPAYRVLLAGLASDGVNAIVGADGKLRTEHRVLQQLYDLGAGPHFDIFAIHPYYFKTRQVDLAVAKVKTARAVMEANGDRGKRVWVNEIGMSTFRNSHIPTITEAQQADELTTLYPKLLALPYVDKVFWYNFRCKGTDTNDKEHNYGIVNFDITPRPVYDAYRRMKKYSKRPAAS